MKKSNKTIFISFLLALNVLLMACAAQNDDYISDDYHDGNLEETASEGVSSDDMTLDVVSGDILSSDVNVGTYEGRPISYNVEDYIFLSMEEAYEWLSPYGFSLAESDSGNWLCRYAETRPEHWTIGFQYSDSGQLEYIDVFDFCNAEEEWSLYGANCRMTLEEMKDWVREQGAAIIGHNMVLYGSGIGLEKLGIGRISWSCGSDYVDWMAIDINTQYVDFLQDAACEIEDCETEFTTEDKTTFVIEYPVFASEGENIFDAMNERLQQLVEESGEALCQEDNKDDILYEIECLETQGISISFYRSGDYHFQSLFTFNYDLVEEDLMAMPDDLQKQVEDHREMLEEEGAYDILSWYINPMQIHVMYYNQTSEDKNGFDYWRN